MKSKHVLLVILGVWLGVQPFLTARRVSVFRSNLILWTDARDRHPDMPRARINIADAMWKAGMQQDAVQDLLAARNLLPAAPLALVRKKGYTFLVNVELGNIAAHEGRVADSQSFYLAAAMTDLRLVKFLNKP